MSINTASSTISPELIIQNITFPVTTFNLTQRCSNHKINLPYSFVLFRHTFDTLQMNKSRFRKNTTRPRQAAVSCTVVSRSS